MTLATNDLVYRVIEYDPADEGRHTWKVVAAVVTHASAKQIRIKSPFPDLFRKQYNANALDRVFFKTPFRAIQAFLTAQREAITALDRRRAEIDRAIGWATSQEGM